MDRCFFTLLLLLWLAPAGWCDGWTQSGSTWSHSNGLSVSFPGDFKVTLDPKLGTLNALAQGGFVNLTFTPVQGKDQMKEAMKGIFQTMQMAHVQMKSGSETSQQNGLDVAFQEGSTVMNKVPIYVKLGIFSKKDSYFLMQLIVPQVKLQQNQASLTRVFSSIK